MLSLTSTSRGPDFLAQWAQTIKGSGLRDMLALVMRPNLLSFALGLPAPELLPLEACRTAAAKVLANDPEVLQYQVPAESIKRHLQGLLASRGVKCREDQIFLTDGAQQGIHLLVNLLVN